tara:strand:+ start:541 stop:741 length:201 start_codon:yes stop_codon:yes gene_type:complete
MYKKGGTVTSKELVGMLGETHAAAGTRLKRLSKKGAIERVEGRPIIYNLLPETRTILKKLQVPYQE